jgi:hypothetical protein
VSLLGRESRSVIHAEAHFGSFIRVWCVFWIDLLKIISLVSFIARSSSGLMFRLDLYSGTISSKVESRIF